jgi:hypothetical protein
MRTASGNVTRMRKKHLVLVLSLSLTIAGTFGILAILPPGPGATKANFDRIKKGMKEAEVKEILGSKPLQYSWGPIRLGGPSSGQIGDDEPLLNDCVWHSFWTSEDGSMIDVAFINGIAQEMSWSESTETVIEKLRRWLHLS